MRLVSSFSTLFFLNNLQFPNFQNQKKLKIKQLGNLSHPTLARQSEATKHIGAAGRVAVYYDVKSLCNIPPP